MFVLATKTWCLGKDFMVGCRGWGDEEFSQLLGSFHQLVGKGRMESARDRKTEQCRSTG